LPENIKETKEICIVDKEIQSLIKINFDIPTNSNKIKLNSNISFDEKNTINNKNDNGKLEINIINKGRTYQNNLNNFKNKSNQISDNKYKFINKVKDNMILKPTKSNPRIIIIYDEYTPLSEKKYTNSINIIPQKKLYNKKHKRVTSKEKVEIIYDEYTPIKVDYELIKPGVEIKKYIYTKKEDRQNNKKVIKEEIIPKKEEKKEKISEKINENESENDNVEKDEIVEYKNYENNDQDDEVIENQEENIKNNGMIIEENMNNRHCNSNDDIHKIKEFNENIEQQDGIIMEENKEDEIEENNELIEKGNANEIKIIDNSKQEELFIADEGFLLNKSEDLNEDGKNEQNNINCSEIKFDEEDGNNNKEIEMKEKKEIHWEQGEEIINESSEEANDKDNDDFKCGITK
jgi:hypothetical protein